MALSNLFKMAALSGAVPAVNFYIRKGFNLNETDSNGRTALYFASSRGHFEACISLLEAGAKVDIADLNGIMDFPDFSRHLIMSKMKRRGLYATHQIYRRI